jgi:hypothetical protein
VKHVVAVSFSNDDEAHELANSFGAATLLDKMGLYAEMMAAIMRGVRSDAEMDGRWGPGTGGPVISTKC